MTTRSTILPNSDAGAHVALASSSASDEVAVCAAISNALSVEGDAPPEWVQLFPVATGGFSPNDGRPGWTLKDTAAVLAASMAVAPGGVLGIDYDHAMDLAAPKGERAPAAGWLTELEVRPDGVWGKVDWTAAGAHAVVSREYRFISPSFRHTPDRTVTRILGAGLTNRPALTDLTALASSQGDSMDPILQAVLEALGLPKTADQATAVAAVTTLKSGGATAALCSAAGLQPTATADQLVEAVKGLKATADQAAGSVKAIASAAGLAETATGAEVAAAVTTLKGNASQATLMETQLATLSQRVKSMEADKLSAEVDQIIKDGKFTPAQRPDLLALASVDKACFDRLVANAVPVLKPGERGGPPPKDGELTAEQKSVCAAMGLPEADYKKALAAQTGREG